MNSLDEFGKTAQKLSRNPLGIIALFIVLVYGIAGFVLGISSEHLQSNEKLPLVWFLVFFPVIVLIAFYRLVTHHHVKLYAPNDFPDKEGFFRVLSPAEQRQKLEQEVKAIEAEVPETKSIKVSSVNANGDGILKTISTRHAYVLAEELAFRELESEFKVSVHRQVAFGPDYGVDGIFMNKGLPVAVEIKYSRNPEKNLMALAKEQMMRFSTMNLTSIPSPSFLLAIVVEGLTDEQRVMWVRRIEEMVERRKLSVHIRIYNIDVLKEKYGISDNSTQQA